MHRAGGIRTGWLLLAASIGITTAGCSEDSASLTRDAASSTAADGSAATGNKDGAVAPSPTDAGVKPADSGQAVSPSTDAGRDAGPTFDAAAVIASAVLPAPETATGPEATGVCDVVVDDAKCDTTKLPIVFVHGTVANADSFAHPAKLFTSNGYCPDRITGIEYHSLISGTGDAGTDNQARYDGAKKAIDAEIDRLKAKFGVTQVDLAGHSQGAGHGARYAGENPTKVAHYINLAGRDLPADPGGVPTLNLSSIGDRPATSVVTGGNVVFQDNWLDHSAVASSTESFVEMYKFLNGGKEPQYKTVQCGMPISVAGKAQIFAENTPLPGAKVEVYKLGDQPTMRGTPVATFTLGPDSSFGPFTAEPKAAYEFRLVPPAGDTKRRVSHAYLPPFVRSDQLLRFNFETFDPVTSATSAQVNRGADFSVVIPRSRQKAFVAGRDTITVDGTEIVSRENSLAVTAQGVARSAVIVAYYLFEKSLTHPAYGPGDGKSTLESVIKGAFVNSADFYIPATTPKFVEVKFNGKTLKVPNWPSATEGASVVFVN